MIEMMFDNEKKELSNLINSKSVLQNISYKLDNDKNSIDFFENLMKNIENYDNMNEDITKERMHNYYFRNDLKEMYKVLNMFYQALKSETYIKDKTAAELRKCCSVFPDHIGERMLILISYLPIINIFHEKIEYKKYISQKTDLEKKSMGETMLEYQEDRLFNPHSLMRTKFPKDDEFISYEMRNRYIDKLEKEFTEEGGLEKINESLEHFINLYKESDNLREKKIMVGMIFWDESRHVSSKNSQIFKEALESMSKSFDKEKSEKLEKIKLILSSEISTILNKTLNEVTLIKNKNSEVKDEYLFKFNIKEFSGEEKIKDIEKIFLLKKDYELTDLRIWNIRDNLYEFKCKIDLT